MLANHPFNRPFKRPSSQPPLKSWNNNFWPLYMQRDTQVLVAASIMHKRVGLPTLPKIVRLARIHLFTTSVLLQSCTIHGCDYCYQHQLLSWSLSAYLDCIALKLAGEVVGSVCNWGNCMLSRLTTNIVCTLLFALYTFYKANTCLKRFYLFFGWIWLQCSAKYKNSV